jgi:Asp-tRNA(Asn)/Glu-tRNA(Gln) amidotransferase A subunit family amidase
VAVFEDDRSVPVTPETRTAVRRAAVALKDAGCVVEDCAPGGLEEARTLWWAIFGRASRLILEPLVAGHEREVHPNLVQFLDWTRRDPPLEALELLDVEIRRDLLKGRMQAWMERYPLILCPVAPIPAFRHGERTWHVDGREIHYLDAWRYTAWFNLLQNPGVSVPVLEAGGLPIGAQLVSAPWNEPLALAAARVVEQARGPWSPPPAPFGDR